MFNGEKLPSVHPDEDLLLPPSLRDWLPEKHLAVRRDEPVWSRG